MGTKRVDAQQELIAELEREFELEAAAEVECDQPLSLIEFVDRAYPRYQWFRHNLVLANRLQQVADGQLKRLMVFMPPRGGKSLLTSKLFPAYYLYRNPDRFVGLNAYSAELAYTFSRASRQAYLEMGGRLKIDAAAVKHWETPEGGGCWAAGVGGSITGKGYSVGLIDDPLKNAEEAFSDRIRAKQQEWYESTFYTRAEPDGAIVVVQCMTGDTPVLMADGTELPLREIKVGDQIATYDNGKLSASTVRNHASNGRDNIFKIITTNGKVVRANERHPFLVDERGELKWIRLKNLTTVHKIVTVKDSGANGKGKPVPPRAAKKPLNAEGTAIRTTKRKNGLMGIALRQLMRNLTVAGISDIGTASPLLSMMRCWRRKMVNVLSASNLRGAMYAHIGEGSCALITATTPIQSENSCATTAILPWDMPSQKQPRLQWLSTSDFTSEAIASIEPDGIEEVFDIQVERTENFIANGLVSHNTRWHEGDLSGWLLQQEASTDEPEHWHVVNFEALKEVEPPQFPATCTIEPDWRSPGEALCPERFSAAKLNRIKRKVGTLFWSAMYQQRPSPAEGDYFKRGWWKFYQQAPSDFEQIIFSWDCAFKETSKSDFVVGQVWGKRGADFYLLDQVRDRMDINATLSAICTLSGKYPTASAKLVEDKANGPAVIDLLNRKIPGLIAVEPEGGKLVRAVAIAPYVESGNVFLPDPSIAPWVHDYIQEFATFPNGSHDDQVDCTSQAINWLVANQPGTWGTGEAAWGY